MFHDQDRGVTISSCRLFDHLRDSVSLMADIIRDFCRPGETIVDPFAGSGTTIVAAKQLGIGAFGCELNAKHANYANRRIAAASRIA